MGVGYSWTNGETRNGSAVQPGLDGTVRADVVLYTLPRACRKVDGGSNALRREIRKSSVIVLTIPHQDLRHSAKAEVLICSLSRVWHDDEGDVIRVQGFGRLAGRELLSVRLLCRNYFNYALPLTSMS